MDKDSLDNLVSKVKEMVKANPVRVMVKDSRVISTTMVMDNSVVAPTMDMVISLVMDKDNRDKDLVMAVLKDRDKTPVTGLVMNVAVDTTFLD
jgi:hypothetical protein